MNKTILVTGASGQLGSELKDLSSDYPDFRFMFTDVDELDITDQDKTMSQINDLKPGWVINCAGYTAVDRAETDADKAFELNAWAISGIVEALSRYGGRMIHISTDYVFDGEYREPYPEDYPAIPISVYGKSKLAGENIALSYPGSIVLRTSWMYSSYGHNFVKTIIRLASERDSVGVVDDQLGSPTNAADLASVIMRIVSVTQDAATSFPAGIYNYSNEGSCSWYSFACSIAEIMNLELRINPISTAQYPLPAPRPVWSLLDKSKIKSEFGIIIPEWSESLRACIKKIKQS